MGSLTFVLTAYKGSGKIRDRVVFIELCNNFFISENVFRFET